MRRVKKTSKTGFFLIALILLIIGAVYRRPETITNQPIKDMTDIPFDVIESLKKTSKPKPNIFQKDAESLSFRMPILLYHYVEYVQDKGDTIRQSLNIEPFIFEEQVKTLQKAGFTFITPSDIPNIVNRKTQLPSKPIILSFDDGYRDFYTDVFPILKKYNIKAVVYVVTGFLNLKNNLLENQLKEIAQSGLVEIGAHTANHAYLKGLPANIAKEEIVKSKNILEKDLQIPISAFAYPYGVFDLKTIKLVKDAGFTTAVSTIPGIEANKDNLYFLFRIRPGKRTGEDLLYYLKQTQFKDY